VAILGRGIAVVEQADETEVDALLGNKTILRMRRNDIAWNRQNMCWEAKDLAPYSAKRHSEPKFLASCLPTMRSRCARHHLTSSAHQAAARLPEARSPR
jgi:hypothetical protein